MKTPLEDFVAALENPHPPEGVSEALEALWHAARGDWQQAHELVQSAADGDGAWVHAYLHRTEGDLSNALYWYKRAGMRRPRSSFTLQEEWNSIVEALLERK